MFFVRFWWSWTFWKALGQRNTAIVSNPSLDPQNQHRSAIRRSKASTASAQLKFSAISTNCIADRSNYFTEELRNMPLQWRELSVAAWAASQGKPLKTSSKCKRSSWLCWANLVRVSYLRSPTSDRLRILRSDSWDNSNVDSPIWSRDGRVTPGCTLKSMHCTLVRIYPYYGPQRVNPQSHLLTRELGSSGPYAMLLRFFA